VVNSDKVKQQSAKLKVFVCGIFGLCRSVGKGAIYKKKTLQSLVAKNLIAKLKLIGKPIMPRREMKLQLHALGKNFSVSTANRIFFFFFRKK